MTRKIINMLFLFSVHICVSSQNSTKISNSYDFFTKNGDTILYRSEFFCSESDVDWLMNKRTRLYALVDSNFNVLTDFKYDSFYPIYGNTAIVRRNGNWGLINKRGEELIDFIYPNEPFLFWDEFLKKDFFLFEKKNKAGVFDDNGILIIPFRWKRIVYCNYGIFQLENGKGNNYLYFEKNKKKISIKRHSVSTMFNRYGKSVFRDLRSNKCGVIDTSGIIVKPCIYSEKEARKFLE